MIIQAVDTDDKKVSVYFNTDEMDSVTIQDKDGWNIDMSSDTAIDLALSILMLHQIDTTVTYTDEEEEETTMSVRGDNVVWVNQYLNGAVYAYTNKKDANINCRVNGVTKKFVEVVE
jgi:hypothetical protein